MPAHGVSMHPPGSVVELVTKSGEATHVYRFAVRLDDRDVKPLDPASEALVQRVRQWAAR